jgi:tetratricopeptide (TPR) repeat protein
MDVDNITIPENNPAVRRVTRRQLVQQAITLAMQSRWQEAIEANKQIVDITSGDAEAYNRLGKAYTELGRIAEAREAYQNGLQADPANLIAQRNLDRLSRITEAEAAELAKRAGQKLDPRFFMEETGKTGITVLQAVAGPEVLTTLSAGDQVELRDEDGQLAVTTTDGVRVGVVDAQLATRLTRLMQTGNRYLAGVVGVDNNQVRIIIRETYQAPQNAGRISFPPRVASEALPRPYLREGLVRRAASGDEEEEDELDLDMQDDLGDDEEEDASEFGFHEGTLDET